MPAAATLLSSTLHPGLITSGCMSVLIAALPAARQGDQHTCLLPPLAGPHPPNAITGGSATVRIGGMAAARVGDLTGCQSPVTTGVPQVLIGG